MYPDNFGFKSLISNNLLQSVRILSKIKNTDSIKKKFKKLHH